MKKLSILFVLIYTVVSSQIKTPYEQGNGNQTTTYAAMQSFYKNLEKQYPSITYKTMGEDDNGEPINVVVYDPKNNPSKKTVLLINNGIHPGEPDGIDATMMLMRDYATGRQNAPKNVVIVAIAAYNISGMQNRNQFSRANQNGPEQYGFRGNARNFDLNRDFIKTDSKNSRSFQKIYHHYNPDVFIDNHVSNGADYQYTLTYISTNKQRLGNTLGTYFHDKLQANILKDLDNKGIISVPYVNVHNDVPDKGFDAFMDTPRYTSGYTTLFNTMGTVVETHMLKPYKDRVAATYDYMISTINYMENNTEIIKEKRKTAINDNTIGNDYPLRWAIDSTKINHINFKGYVGAYKQSLVSGQPRLYYDRSKSFEKKVPYYDTYKATTSVKIPKYYVIPKSEYRVIELLKLNLIELKPIKKDSLITVETYRIKDFATVKNPYEGHYLHYNTVVERQTEKLLFANGDYLVPLQQNGMKFLLETLEPEAVDSYFNWNFFDAILGQKEYYSAYVFEDTAAQLLKTDKALKTAFELEKAKDPNFNKDADAQLDWIYKNSPYYEKTHRLYPIFRIN